MERLSSLRILRDAALALIVASSLATGAALVACSNDSDAPHDQPVDSGQPADTGVDTGTPFDTGTDSGTPTDAISDANDASDASETVPECYTNPKTHYEIINACTDAARVDKKPTGLPFLADGGLPPPP